MDDIKMNNFLLVLAVILVVFSMITTFFVIGNNDVLPVDEEKTLPSGRISFSVIERPTDTGKSLMTPARSSGSRICNLILLGFVLTFLVGKSAAPDSEIRQSASKKTVVIRNK